MMVNLFADRGRLPWMFTYHQQRPYWSVNISSKYNGLTITHHIKTDKESLNIARCLAFHIVKYTFPIMMTMLGIYQECVMTRNSITGVKQQILAFV